MKDFFGTVIEPGDAVVVARNAPGAGMVGTLALYTAVPKKRGDGLTLRDRNGALRHLSWDESNTISMKSIASSARKD